MKSEVKIELDNSKLIRLFLGKVYKNKGLNKIPLIIKKSDDPLFYSVVDEMDNDIIRILNKDVIDGFLRALVQKQNKEIRIYPISTNFIEEDGRYNFY